MPSLSQGRTNLGIDTTPQHRKCGLHGRDNVGQKGRAVGQKGRAVGQKGRAGRNVGQKGVPRNASQPASQGNFQDQPLSESYGPRRLSAVPTPTTGNEGQRGRTAALGQGVGDACTQAADGGHVVHQLDHLFFHAIHLHVRAWDTREMHQQLRVHCRAHVRVLINAKGRGLTCDFIFLIVSVAEINLL